MDPVQDPSRSSYYVGDEFYAGLVQAFTDWDRDDLIVDDYEERDAVRRFLDREARALDQLRHDDWLAMFAPECAYWIPATVERGDPREEIAFAFHDRRQLEDRIYRLRTGYAWSQTPVSRTVRLISNVEVFRTDDAAIRMARATFLVTEFRAGDRATWSGWSGYRLQRQPGLSILAKQVNLIDCDQSFRNPSITL